MEVSTDIHRTDLIKFNWHLLPREKANRFMVLIVAIAVFVYLLIANQPNDVVSIGIALAVSLAGGVAGLLATFLFTLAWILLMSSEKTGVLGKHHYVVTGHSRPFFPDLV